MSSTSVDRPFEVKLDIFGQRLVVIFTQISFCFPNDSGRSIDELQHILEQGLDRLADAFPWIAGQVICEGATASETGTFKIAPLDKRPRLTMRDYREQLRMQDLRSSGFRMADLHESLVAPRNTSSGRPGQTLAEVFQLQATIVKDGLILTFLGQHQALDGVGMGQVIYLFSKACRGEAYTEEEIRICGLNAQQHVSLYDESWSPGSELDYNIVKTDSAAPGPGHPKSKIPSNPGTWCYFNIDARSCLQIKEHATKSLAKNCAYVSTDDAVSAFLWQAITRARYEGVDKSKPVLFARAVDLRRYLDISSIHPGFMQSMTYHSFAADKLVSKHSLGSIAADLRAAMNPEKLRHHSRSFATLISRTPDKTHTSYLAGFDMSRDVMLSSWSNQNSYEQDFGLGLGTPKAVRRPYFASFPGLVYLMPKAPNGDIGVAVCLSEHDMNSLVADQEFASYARCGG